MTPIDILPRWVSQPQEGLRIALDNPVAESLQLLVIGSAPVNLVNGLPLYGVSTSAPYVDVPPSAPTPSDMGLESPDLGCASPFFGRDTGALLADPSRLTLLAWHRLRSDTAYSTGLINGWLGASGAGFGIGIRYSSANFYPQIAGSSTLEHSVSLRDDRWHLLGVSHTSGAGKAWKDGVLVKTGAVSTPTQIFPNNYEHFRTGRSPLLMLFSRELRADEHESLYENQWQLVEPVPIWVPVSFGAASTTHDAVGALAADAATVSGAAARTRVHAGAGALTASSAEAAGTATRTRVHAAGGALEAAGAEIVGSASRADPVPGHGAAGALTAGQAQAAGVASRARLHGSAGALLAQDAGVSGAATHTRSHIAGGALVAGVAGVSGEAYIGDAPVQTRNAGFEMGGPAPRKAREVHRKPILEQILEARAARSEPVAKTAKRRAKAIEIQAARAVLEDRGEVFGLLLRQWAAQKPVLSPLVDDAEQAFMAQVKARIQAMEQDDEDVLLLVM